jgi:hypothetical protein
VSGLVYSPGPGPPRRTRECIRRGGRTPAQPEPGDRRRRHDPR